MVGKARRARELESTLNAYRETATCDKGDFMEYAALRERITRAQKDSSRLVKRQRREAGVETLTALRRGDVVRIGSGKRQGFAVVTVPDDHVDAPRPTVVSDDARAFRLAIADLQSGIDAVGAIKVKKGVDTRNARVRRELAQQIVAARETFDAPSRRKAAPEQDHQQQRVDALRREMAAHPCHSCPDREQHARWAERYHRTLRDRDRLTGEIARATGSISALFDRRCAVLRELGYLDGDGPHTAVTDAGALMKRLYSDNDLVIAECLRTGVWQELHPPALAAAVSTLLYGGRREDETRTPHIPGGPGGVLGRALKDTVRAWSRIDDLQHAHRLPDAPAPQWGIVSAIHAWAQGKNLDVALKDSEIAPGDMVRWCKQVIDVLDQVAQVAPSDVVRTRAQTAIEAMRRGVVAY
ncbi:hypothetical protein GCM10025876_38360 [Demequina litorisediminis]|uniref:ATP-dependent RNA helicase Ski2/MTR4 C-terminal domain-containing protein n=1 Tax=Demequina litorisediminis TaxID=1849022 RepID=A0ABQ6II91_9MICO|nr:hypothetical protein GCM10025876_38360 [Demequina litorisediminis]